MATKAFGPRKQRTRQHLIADQSVNYVERFIIDEGHTAQQFERDYGYDMLMSTYDPEGYLEPGATYLQLKASENLQRVHSDYVFDVDIRDYNLWTLEQAPVILVLFEASRRRAYWLHVQEFFRETARVPQGNTRTVRVHVPQRQAVNRRAVAQWRNIKWMAKASAIGAPL